MNELAIAPELPDIIISASSGAIAYSVPVCVVVVAPPSG